MKWKFRKPSPAMIVACVALFVALGPAAYASHLVVTTSDIVDGEVRSPDLRDFGVTNTKLAANVVGTGKIIDGHVTTPDLANGAVTAAKLGANSVDGTKVADGTLGSVDIQDESIEGNDIHSAPPFGTGGLNGDVEIIDNTIIGFFDIASGTVTGTEVSDNSLTATDINEGSFLDAGRGTDGACFDDDENGEVCAGVTFSTDVPGNLLVNATGEWRTFTGGNAMTCILRVDGAQIGLAQSFGEAGTNHSGGRPGTMALTAMSGSLAAGNHTVDLFCTQTEADIDLLNNQLTVALVDDGTAVLSSAGATAAEAAK